MSGLTFEKVEGKFCVSAQTCIYMLPTRCMMKNRHKKRKSNMTYKKPKIVAMSKPQKSYVAGCPAKDATTQIYVKNNVRYSYNCKKCEISGRA